MPTVGEKIRAARILQGLTQADLSGDLVTVSMISQIEMNKTRPSVHLLEHIARRLSLPVAYFTDGSDDVASPDMQWTVAKYYQYIEDSEQSHAALEADGLESEVKNVTYLLLQTRLKLREGQYTDCAELLEEIREVALATQDQQALLNVHQLSGYVQYGMRHLAAAIHEWERAITLGESLLKDSSGSRFNTQTILADALYASYQAHKQMGNTQQAKADLRRAEALSRAWATLRTVSDSLFQDGQEQQESGSGLLASKLFEKSVWTLEIGSGLTTRSRILADLNKENSKDNTDKAPEPLDPWLHSVLATTSSSPRFAMDANLSWIRGRIAAEAYGEAVERIEHCLHFIDQNYVLPEDQALHMRYQFRSLLAQTYFARDRREEAVHILTDAIEQSADALSSEEILLARGLQLKWLRELHRVEEEKEVIERIMETLQSMQKAFSYAD